MSIGFIYYLHRFGDRRKPLNNLFAERNEKGNHSGNRSSRGGRDRLLCTYRPVTHQRSVRMLTVQDPLRRQEPSPVLGPNLDKREDGESITHWPPLRARLAEVVFQFDRLRVQPTELGWLFRGASVARRTRKTNGGEPSVAGYRRARRASARTLTYGRGDGTKATRQASKRTTARW
jgi:hypothetical protein